MENTQNTPDEGYGIVSDTVAVLVCPYCENAINLTHDEIKVNTGKVEHTCSECAKGFDVTTTVSYDMKVEKISCYEESKHDWKWFASEDARSLHPKLTDRQFCTVCGEQRQSKNLEDEFTFPAPVPMP